MNFQSFRRGILPETVYVKTNRLVSVLYLGREGSLLPTCSSTYFFLRNKERVKSSIRRIWKVEYTPFPQRRNERRNKCISWDVFPAVAIVVDHSLPILSDYAYSKKVKSLTEMKKHLVLNMVNSTHRKFLLPRSFHFNVHNVVRTFFSFVQTNHPWL